MTRYSKRLTVDEIERAMPGDRPMRLFDGGGLHLKILHSGGKVWRMKYRFRGREKQLSFGPYPEVSISEARERLETAKKLLAQGVDPAVLRREQKARATGDWLAQEGGSKFHVAFALDGGVEIWKGRAVVRLIPDEARAVKDLLTKLIA